MKRPGRPRGSSFPKFQFINRRPGAWAEPLEARQLLSTYTVNTLSDPLFAVKGTLSLREAIADANADAGADTIAFAPSLFTGLGLKTITLARGQLVLSDTSGATVITGPGAARLAVSGNGVYRVLDVAAKASATLSGLTITGGLAAYDADKNYEGGGIFNAGSLTLNGVTVSGNNAIGSNALSVASDSTQALGGGIYSTGTLTIQNSTVSGNSATGASVVQNTPAGNYPGETAYGGGICSTGSLTIAGSTISSNAATAGAGGMLSFAGQGGDALGGGIYSHGTLSLSASTLSGNKAVGGNTNDASGTTPNYAGTADGGAIFCVSATITSSTLSGNTAAGGQGAGYNVVGASGIGGGVYCTGALTLSASTVSTNHCTTGMSEAGQGEPDGGGGIYAGGKLSVVQSTVSGNTADGGIGNYGGLPGGNAYGGGIWATAALAVSQSTISGNTVTGGTGNDGSVAPPLKAGNGGNGLGGGIYATASSVVSDSTLANNSAIGGAGGYTMGNAPSGGGNGGNGNGGAVRIAAGASFQLLDSTVSGNNATAGAGGAGYDMPNEPVLPPGKPGAAAGAGLSIFGSALLDNSIVSANHANSAFNDIAGVANASSANNLIGIGGGLTNNVHGNKVGVTNPKLSALGNNGGPTQTLVPLAGSPAIDAGSNALIPSGVATDQRGLPRIFNKTVDIGADEYSVVTITGSVFNDLTGDGVRQSSDPGLANWQVFVDLTNVGYYVSGDPIATTNSSGNYSLPVTLQPGAGPLIIREVRQNNWRRTDPAGIYPLGYYSLTPTTATIGNINFGDSATALITGTVFDDKNANGKQDSGEAGLAGWTIEIDAYIKGVWKNNAYSATTNSTSVYSIVLAPGSYRLHEVTKNGLKPTIPSSGSYSITLAAGATVTGVNFGDK